MTKKCRSILDEAYFPGEKRKLVKSRLVKHKSNPEPKLSLYRRRVKETDHAVSDFFLKCAFYLIIGFMLTLGVNSFKGWVKKTANKDRPAVVESRYEPDYSQYGGGQMARDGESQNEFYHRAKMEKELQELKYAEERARWRN